MDVSVNYFFELINILFTSIFLMLLRKRFNLDDASFLLLFFHFLLIFLTNYLFFSPMYMGDQFTYLATAQYYRGMDVLSFSTSMRIAASSMFFAYFPIPMINSIYSIAMINFLMYVILFLFLRERGVLTGFNRFFYLLYPSLALYSSMALRDTLIFFLMALFLYYVFMRKQIVRPLAFFGVPLFILKYQNFFVVLITLVVFILLHKKYHPALKVLILIGFGLCFYLFSHMLTINNLNNIRLLFYLENNPSFIGFHPFASWLEAGSYGLTSFFSFLMEPLVWKSKNIFQFIQSLENIAILLILVSLFFTQRKKVNMTEKTCLILFIIAGILIYSMVIINAGAAARYRYPFIGLFIIFFNYFKSTFSGNQCKPAKKMKKRLVSPLAA